MADPLRDEGFSAASVRQTRQVLCAHSKWPWQTGLWCETRLSVKLRRSDHGGSRPHHREVGELAEACEDRQPGAGAVVFFLAWSGLRGGEAVALRLENVGIERRRVEVKALVTEGRASWSGGVPLGAYGHPADRHDRDRPASDDLEPMICP